MSRLTAAARRKLKKSSFAGPNGAYPDEDKGHGEAAIARVKEFGSPELQRRVVAAVHRKFKKLGKKKGAR